MPRFQEWSSSRKAALCVLAAFLLLLLFHEPLLAALGRAVVSDEPPAKADAIFVLAGDYTGERVLAGCRLAQAGLAPKVLISGPMDFYGVNEGELAYRYAIAQGCPQHLLEVSRVPAKSTREEAAANLPVFRQRGFHSVLIVTSNFHTARALRTFRRVMGSQIDLRMAAAPFVDFEPDSWWKHRQGQKTMFFEVAKTLADYVGL